MKTLLAIITLLFVSSCSSNLHVVEKRDIFLDFDKLSHLVCAGDYSENNFGELTDSKLINLTHNLAEQIDRKNMEPIIKKIINHTMCLNFSKQYFIDKNIRTLSKKEEKEFTMLFEKLLDLKSTDKNENIHT